ncbi:hypothetical protein ACHHYP_20182 [Achlya hypogyna]|uniref:Uncharacterized protein n=1 Tax=Achlya hypogyna TaxID=1202772 RepID=A0A1V9Z0V6_ACHHY|nr:hypothetical protein ACHHYP_20182 [Achlya hypogyna]
MPSITIAAHQVRIKTCTTSASSSTGSSHSSSGSSDGRRRNTIVDEAMHHLLQDLKEVDFASEPEKATEALDTFRHHLETMRKMRSRRHSTASDPRSRPYVDMSRCSC